MKRETITDKLPSHTECFKSILSAKIYIRDYKHYDLVLARNIDNRGVVIDDKPDPNWASVVLDNSMPESLVVDADCFPENALPEDKAGIHASQCECIIFPADGIDDDWVLFVETKYTESAEIAKDEKVKYPKKMFTQIKSTISYFRRKEIIDANKRVHAIMSYPKLLEPFDGWNLPVEVEDEETGDVLQLTTEEILQRYKIHLRPTNHAQIISPKRIRLG